MIVNGAGTIILDGVNNKTSVFKKNENGEAVQSNFYVADGAGKVIGVLAVAVVGGVVVYFITTEELSSLCKYTISGTTAPPNSKVYVAEGYESGNIDILSRNIIASCTSDDAGEFIMENVQGIDGIVSIWTCVPAEYAQTGGITCSVEVVSNMTVSSTATLLYEYFATSAAPLTCPTCDGQALEDGGTCPACNGKLTFAEPLYTLTGLCSSDITTVYVSAVDEEAELVNTQDTIAMLSGNVVSSCVQSGGTYENSFICTSSSLFAVWGLSETGNLLTIEDVTIEEGEVECVTADTLITMADGSKRKIEDVRIGEYVMDKTGAPTKVRSVSRGRYSPYYTIYTFEDGTTVKEVKSHRFYNSDQGFYQHMSNWKIGEHAVKQDGEKVALVSSERVYVDTERFGLWTKDGSYFANELLSGVASCNRRLLANATAEQAVNMMLSIPVSRLMTLMGLEGVLP